MPHFVSNKDYLPETAVKARLYDAQSVREFDRIAIQQYGIPGIQLMKRAGRAAFAELLTVWGKPQQVTVFCGAGNNGGDGYIIAAVAHQQNISARIIELGQPDKLSGDAFTAREFALAQQVPMQAFSADLELYDSVVVDAMLGTGFSGEVREPMKSAIELINASALPVLAVDIPSGLASDSGAVINVAVKADITVTFIGAKQGLFSGRGPALCGDVVYHSLDIPREVFEKVTHTARLMDLCQLLDRLPDRPVDAHKNQFGHVMVIGGDHGYGGAALMAVGAALRVGAGLVSLATRPENIGTALCRYPAAMSRGVNSGQALEPLLEKPSVLVVGPGLGQSAWSEQLLQKALATGLPMVLDADALNIIAAGRLAPGAWNTNRILTPHPGEAARLLDCDTVEIQQDRFTAVQRLQQKYNATVLLKGSGSLVAGKPELPVAVCPYGNPGMATGGMGDVLSGIIGGLLAQGLSPPMAVELGCSLHAAAADRVAEAQGKRGLLPTDLLPMVRKLLNRNITHHHA